MMSSIKDRLIPAPLDSEVKRSFISYAMAVIVNRALPDVRDGLKPVHRRIIYAMNELGMTNDKPYRKSARIVGDVLGKYHPHGDSSVYDAMVRLAQDFNIRYPLVEGQGNFGSIDGDGAAAMRYTEAKMSKLSAHLIGEIDKDTVDFYPNFDGTLMQPSVLPSRFPNLLVNGSSGIAVGMATNIPPHNLGEVIDAVVALIENPDLDIHGLMEHIKGPDFPTGAIIFGSSAIKDSYFTGRGRIVVRAKAEIETLENGKNRIIVSEIPYQVNKARLIENIARLVGDKKIEGISDIRDESDREGMRIVIDIKRDAQSQVVLNMLYKHTQMQETFGANMLALVNGEPKTLNLKEMLSYYLAHQEDIVTRRTRYDLDKAQARAHIVEGLLKALDNIDEVVHIIRSSKDTQSAKQSLMDRFDFSDKQAQAILDMRLARLTNLEADKLQAEFDGLKADIAYFTNVLNDKELLLSIIKKELIELKDKFADERRTEISFVEGEIDSEALIPQDNMVVTMTHRGYVKRLSQNTYRTQNRGGRGVNAMSIRDGDYLEQMYIIHSHSRIFFFTDKGRAFCLKCYEIPEAARTAKGTSVVNLLQLQGEEKVTTMLPLPDLDENMYLLMATQNGMIKKTEMSEFTNIRKNGIRAITLVDDDTLIGVSLSDGTKDIMLVSKHGKAIRFSEESIRASGRSAQGVRSMKLSSEDSIVSMSCVEENKAVLTISENGFGKRSAENEYRTQGRAGLGLTAAKINEKTGDLVAVRMVDDADELLIITDDGTMIRTPVSSIRECARVSQGVKLMKLADGIKIVDVEIALPDEDDESDLLDGFEEGTNDNAILNADEGEA